MVIKSVLLDQYGFKTGLFDLKATLDRTVMEKPKAYTE